jgi:hypothetical protein
MSFNADFYRKVYTQLAKFDDPTLAAHYNKYGRSEGRIGSIAEFYQKNPFFNWNYYMANNPDLINVLKNEKSAIIHYLRYGISEGRTISTKHLDFGVNIIGFFKGAFGEAELARNIAYGLSTATVPFFANPVKIGCHNFTVDYTLNLTKMHNFAINIVCIKWDMTEIINSHYSNYLDNKHNIAVWTFETDTMLRSTVPVMDQYHKIFTISEFCKSTILKENSNKDVHVLDIPITNNPVTLSRDEILNYFNNKYGFQFNSNSFICAIIFDYNSSVNRKNSFDGLKAFDNSLGHIDNCFIILKTINRKHKNTPYKQLRNYIKTLKYNHKVINLEAVFTEEELDMFYSMINIYISLHRSEGLGLTMLKSISMGIPTVCTAYSGNLDFCRDFNCCLVPYTKIDIQPTDDAYFMFAGISQWAQPDVAVASNYLLDIYNNYGRYKAKFADNNYINTKYNRFRLGQQVLGAVVNLNNQMPLDKTYCAVSNKLDALNKKYDLYLFGNFNMNSIMTYYYYNDNLGVVANELTPVCDDKNAVVDLCAKYNIDSSFCALYDRKLSTEYLTFNNCPLYVKGNYVVTHKVVSFMATKNVAEKDFDLLVGLVVFHLKLHSTTQDKLGNIKFFK